MAHLEVKPKSGTPWWLWLLIALIVIAILLFLLKGCNGKNAGAKKDSTATTTTTDTSTTRSTTGDSSKKLAATHPDYSSVDFNAPSSNYGEITDKGISVKGNNKYTIYSLGEDILFATDQSTVQPKAEVQLKQVASSINKRFKGATIAVFGRTDSTGTTGHNKALGADRAKSVSMWLINNAGIPAEKISVQSFGEDKPLASNNTATGRKENRSVEIVVFPDSSNNKK